MTTLLLPFMSEIGDDASRSRDVEEALSHLASSGSIEERGAVFTRKEVVSLILDLCGYVTSCDLMRLRVLEPSMGQGAFLCEIIVRLVKVWRLRHGEPPWSDDVVFGELGDRICAVELHAATAALASRLAQEQLISFGFSAFQASGLLERWCLCDDFLLTTLPGASFDVIVGNPPYVRQEQLLPALLGAYRSRYKTLYDRADLYVLFYERCLGLLSARGTLGFICANRWVKNRYGGPLRAMVAREFFLKYYVDLKGVSAFNHEVDAYPAITVITAEPQPVTRVLPVVSSGERLAEWSAASLEPRWVEVSELAREDEPWLLDDPEAIAVLRELERVFTPIESDGVAVGIGVATGCDRVFIGDYEALDVETERKLPLAMASDISSSALTWSGHGLVNPWADEGRGLAHFEAFPRFASYLEQHREALSARYVARKQPARWYKTIDRVVASLQATPKLLIPDIKGDAAVAYDPGKLYPHHNLYVITSSQWELRAMQAILRSSIARAFIGAYSVHMAGGFLRFQAQYLRRICVPRWEALSLEQRARLAQVAQSSERAEIDEVVFEVYGLSASQREVMSRFAASVGKVAGSVHRLALMCV